MVHRIILTQPLAAGPDGDWEFDLLMEAKPVSPTGSPLFQVVREMANAPAPAAAVSEPASADAQADEDMTVSDDDEFEDDSKRESVQGARRSAPGPELSPDRESTGKVLAATDGAGGRKAMSFQVPCARVTTGSVAVVLPCDESVPEVEADHATPPGPGSGEVDAQGNGVREPMSPGPLLATSEGMLCSPESAEAEPEPDPDPDDDDADSSFSGSPGDRGDGSSSEEDQEEDDDGYEPEVPFPPCSLMHQRRKTYKDSLCKECYHTYKRNLEAAGVQETDGNEQRSRRQLLLRRGRSGKRGRNDVTADAPRHRLRERAKRSRRDGVEEEEEEEEEQGEGPQVFRLRKRKRVGASEEGTGRGQQRTDKRDDEEDAVPRRAGARAEIPTVRSRSECGGGNASNGRNSTPEQNGVVAGDGTRGGGDADLESVKRNTEVDPRVASKRLVRTDKGGGTSKVMGKASKNGVISGAQDEGAREGGTREGAARDDDAARGGVGGAASEDVEPLSSWDRDARVARPGGERKRRGVAMNLFFSEPNSSSHRDHTDSTANLGALGSSSFRVFLPPAADDFDARIPRVPPKLRHGLSLDSQQQPLAVSVIDSIHGRPGLLGLQRGGSLDSPRSLYLSQKSAKERRLGTLIGNDHSASNGPLAAMSNSKGTSPSEATAMGKQRVRVVGKVVTDGPEAQKALAEVDEAQSTLLKRNKGREAGDGGFVAQKAGYVRVAECMGVMKKVTNGNFYLWVGDRLHDGKPYDSAEECARDYEKLQLSSNQRKIPPGNKSYFSDRRKKGPREMAGITALIPNPGSRIAKRIMSGYSSGGFPSNSPKSSASVSRQPSTAEFQQSSGAESRGSSATEPRQSGVEDVRQPSAGDLRQPNVTNVRQPGPVEFPDGGVKRSQSETISLSDIMSFGNTNVDLPMRRSVSDPGSDCAPTGSSKVRWCDPLKSGPPMDGRHMPCLPWAIPRLSAMKGGREGRVERNCGFGGTRGIGTGQIFSESCAAVNERGGAGEGQGRQSGGKIESRCDGDGGVIEAERNETIGNASPRHGAGRMSKSSLASVSFVSSTSREEYRPLWTKSHDPVTGDVSPRPQQAHGASRSVVQSGLARSPAMSAPTARAYVPPGPPSAPAARAPSAKKVGVQTPKALNSTAKSPTPRVTTAQETVEQAPPTLRTHMPKATAEDAELLSVQASTVQIQGVPAPMRQAPATQGMAARGSNAQARILPTSTTQALPTTQASTWAKALPVQASVVPTPAAVVQALPVVSGQPSAAEAKAVLAPTMQGNTMLTPTVPAPSLQASREQARTSQNLISRDPEANASSPRFVAVQSMIEEAPTTPALAALIANSRVEPVQERAAQEPNSQPFAANVPTIHGSIAVTPVSSTQAPAVEESSHAPHAKSNAVEARPVEIKSLRASLTTKLSAVLTKVASARVKAAQETTRESVVQSPRIQNSKAQDSTPARSVAEGPDAEKASTVALSGSQGELVATGAQSARIGEAGSSSVPAISGSQPAAMPDESDKNDDATTKASQSLEGGGAEEHRDGAPELVAVRDDVSEVSSVSSSDSPCQNESSAGNERPSGGVTVRLCDHLAQVRQLASGSDASLPHEVDLKGVVRRESVDSGAEERGRELLSAMMMMSDGERESSRRDDDCHVPSDGRHVVDVNLSGVDWSDHDQVAQSTEDLVDSHPRDAHSMDDGGLEGTVAETEENDGSFDRGEDAEEDKDVAHMPQAVIRIEEAVRETAPEAMDVSDGSDAARSMSDESALQPFSLDPSVSAHVQSSVRIVGGRASHGDAVTRNAFLPPTPDDDGDGNESCVPSWSPTPGDTDGDHEEACVDGTGTASSVPTTSFASVTWQVLPTPRTSVAPGSPCSASSDAQSVLGDPTQQTPAATSEDGSDGSKSFSVEHKDAPLIPRVPWSKPPRLARASSAVEQVRQGSRRQPRALARRCSEPLPSTSRINSSCEAFLQSSVSVDAPSRLLDEGPGIRKAEKIVEVEVDAPGLDLSRGREAKERIACDSSGDGDERIQSRCRLSEARSVMRRGPQLLAPVNEARSAWPSAPSLSGNRVPEKGRDGLTKVPWRPPNRIRTQKPRVVIPAPVRCDSRDPASVVAVAALAGKRNMSPSVSTSTSLSEQDRVTDDGRDDSRTSSSSGSTSGASFGKSGSVSSEKSGRSRDSVMGSSARGGQSGQSPTANDRLGGIPRAYYTSNRGSSSTSCSDESSPRGGSGSGSEGSRRHDDRAGQSGDRGRRNGRTGRSRSRSSSESSSYRRSRRGSDSSDRHHSYVGRRGRDRDDHDRERDERYSRSRRDYSYSRIDWGHCWSEEWASRAPRRTRSSSRERRRR